MDSDRMPGLSAEGNAFFNMYDQLAIRLALRLAVVDPEARGTLRRLRREVVESAFISIPKHSAFGVELARVSDFLWAASSSPKAEIERLEQRYRAYNNPAPHARRR